MSALIRYNIYVNNQWVSLVYSNLYFSIKKLMRNKVNTSLNKVSHDILKCILSVSILVKLVTITESQRK